MQRVARIESKRRRPEFGFGLTSRFDSNTIVNGLPLVCSWFVISIITALVLFVFYMTFVPGLPTEPGWTLKHWAGVATPRMLTEVLPNTLIVGFGTVLVVTFFALPLAWLLNRTSLPFRNVFITLMAVAVVIPGFIKAMGWIMLLNDRIGIVNNGITALVGWKVPLTVVNNPYGMAWVMGLMLTPTMFFLISGPMRALDPSLEEAAMVCGLNRWRLIRRISLPLVWPGTLAGIIYIFMTAISIFEVPALLGAASGKVPVLATELFYAVRPSGIEMIDPAYGVAGVYGTLIAIPSIMALYWYLRLLNRVRAHEVITGKGYRPQMFDLGRFKWLGLAFVLFYLLLAVILPMLVLIWASLLPILQMPSAAAFSKINLAHYNDLLPALGGASVVWNTILLMFWVSALVIFFSLMISWVVVRVRVRFHRLMDVIAMMPHAIPGLAFAFALMILGLLASRWFPWLPFSGTLGIIVIAGVLNRLSYGTRATNAALIQIQSDLEECGRVCGLRTLSIIRKIIIPLVMPTLVFTGLWTALLTFREVTMALFLSESHNRVISVNIWYLWQDGNLGIAAAGSVVMVAVAGTLMLLILSFGTRQFGQSGRPGLGLLRT